MWWRSRRPGEDKTTKIEDFADEVKKEEEPEEPALSEIPEAPAAGSLKPEDAATIAPSTSESSRSFHTAMAEAPKAEEKPTPLNELLTKSMVDIYVGPENTHWILHEKLLCYNSKFFRNVFNSQSSSNKSFSLPDEEDEPFRQFVAWLYSGVVAPPEEEKSLSSLLDLYLMGEKWQIVGLVNDALAAVRSFYRRTDTYPALRRVQYIYANTSEESPMRKLLVGSVARTMVLGKLTPTWDKALKKNGQLAVDIIKTIQSWKLDDSEVPDARQGDVVIKVEAEDQLGNVPELPSEAKGVNGNVGGKKGQATEQLPNGATPEDVGAH